MSKKTRFDLEQDIMACWQSVDDIERIYTYVGDHPDMAGMPAKVEDSLMNLLLGMKAMYDLKFNNLWDTFETCIHDGVFTHPFDHDLQEYTERQKAAYTIKKINGRIALWDHLGNMYEYDRDPDYDVSETFTRGTLYKK